MKRIGIVGYGHLGKFLTNAILEREDMSLAFVWNRQHEKLLGCVDEQFICRDLEDFARYSPDMVVEVAHPVISEKYGSDFLSDCDYLVGSPTALASQDVENNLRKSATTHGLYIPSGALWGINDIAKMAQAKTLTALRVTMKKHPSCFKLASPLKEKNDAVKTISEVLFEGSVKDLCPLAPNNVNTMAAAAIAASNLGFDGVTGVLVSDPSLCDWHIVEVEVSGPTVNGKTFAVSTTRRNPASLGSVTGSATYMSFLSSVVNSGGLGSGVHFC